MILTKDQQGSDFQTPHNIAEYMCSLIPDNVITVFEPTPGIGTIVDALEWQNILGKRSFSITAPVDFFLAPHQRFDCVVMNPPFSSKYAILDNAKEDYSKHGMRLGYEILKTCMGMSDCIIALMPWFTISDSDVRLRYLKDYGLVSVTALPRKTFQYARIQTCVLKLQKGYVGSTEFIVYDRIK